MRTPEAIAELRRKRGGQAWRSGRRAEAWAALWLMAKGYRILGFRLRTRLGEIDLLAQKGGVLAVVEVKSRTSLEAALEAVDAEQRDRLRRAAAAVAGGRPRLRDLAVRLDLVALAPRRLPVHRRDAWRGA